MDPEALLDDLSKISVQKRCCSNLTPYHSAASLLTSSYELDNYVRDFEINDAISESFASDAESEQKKNEEKVEKLSRPLQKKIEKTKSPLSGLFRRKPKESTKSKLSLKNKFYKSKLTNNEDNTEENIYCEMNSVFPAKSPADVSVPDDDESDYVLPTDFLPFDRIMNLIRHEYLDSVVRELPEYNLNDLSSDDRKRSILHQCVCEDLCQCVDAILSTKPELLHKPDEAGIYPTQLAVQMGHAQCLKHLLRSDPVDNQLIHLAVTHNQAECLNVLLTNANPDRQRHNKDGDTPVHLACSLGHLRCLQMLVEAGHSITARNRDGISAIQICSDGHYTECYNYLLMVFLVKHLLQQHVHNSRNEARKTNFRESLSKVSASVDKTTEKRYQTIDTRLKELESLQHQLSDISRRLQSTTYGVKPHHYTDKLLDVVNALQEQIAQIENTWYQQKQLSQLLSQLQHNSSSNLTDLPRTGYTDKEIDQLFSLIIRRLKKSNVDATSIQEVIDQCCADYITLETVTERDTDLGSSSWIQNDYSNVLFESSNDRPEQKTNRIFGTVKPAEPNISRDNLLSHTIPSQMPHISGKARNITTDKMCSDTGIHQSGTNSYKLINKKQSSIFVVGKELTNSFNEIQLDQQTDNIETKSSVKVVNKPRDIPTRLKRSSLSPEHIYETLVLADKPNNANNELQRKTSITITKRTKMSSSTCLNAKSSQPRQVQNKHNCPKFTLNKKNIVSMSSLSPRKPIHSSDVVENVKTDNITLLSDETFSSRNQTSTSADNKQYNTDLSQTKQVKSTLSDMFGTSSKTPTRQLKRDKRIVREQATSDTRKLSGMFSIKQFYNLSEQDNGLGLEAAQVRLDSKAMTDICSNTQKQNISQLIHENEIKPIGQIRHVTDIETQNIRQVRNSSDSDMSPIEAGIGTIVSSTSLTSLSSLGESTSNSLPYSFNASNICPISYRNTNSSNLPSEKIVECESKVFKKSPPIVSKSTGNINSNNQSSKHINSECVTKSKSCKLSHDTETHISSETALDLGSMLRPCTDFLFSGDVLLENKINTNSTTVSPLTSNSGKSQEIVDLKYGFLQHKECHTNGCNDIMRSPCSYKSSYTLYDCHNNIAQDDQSSSTTNDTDNNGVRSDKSSYTSDGDHFNNIRKLDLKNSEASHDDLLNERLEKHLEAIQQLNHTHSDFIETVVAGGGHLNLTRNHLRQTHHGGEKFEENGECNDLNCYKDSSPEDTSENFSLSEPNYNMTITDVKPTTTFNYCQDVESNDTDKSQQDKSRHNCPSKSSQYKPRLKWPFRLFRVNSSPAKQLSRSSFEEKYIRAPCGISAKINNVSTATKA